MEKVELHELIKQFLNEFITLNEQTLDSIVFEESINGLNIKIETSNNGFFIGKNGHSLRNLETVLYAFLKNNSKYIKMHLNIGNYREQHEAHIKKTAVLKAEQVSKTGKQYTFEPMNSYERRLIHTAIQDSVYALLVKTQSTGEGNERRTVLISK